jgi:hypothetical protein
MTPQLTPRKKLEGDHFISFVTPQPLFHHSRTLFRHPRESEGPDVPSTREATLHDNVDPWMPDQVGHDSLGKAHLR